MFVLLQAKRQPSVGRGKLVFRELEDARAAARKKLWNSPTAHVTIARVLGAVEEFAWPPAIEPLHNRELGANGVHLRVVETSPVAYVETVKHTEERIIELAEEQLGRCW